MHLFIMSTSKRGMGGQNVSERTFENFILGFVQKSFE